MGGTIRYRPIKLNLLMDIPTTTYLGQDSPCIKLRSDIETVLFLIHFANNLPIVYSQHGNEIRATWNELTAPDAMYIQRRIQAMKIEINQVKYN